MFHIPDQRQQFPALEPRADGRTPIFLDGPGGTQVCRGVIEAMVHYLSTCNANHGGVFATTKQSDAILEAAHQGMADLINAPSEDEIIFGANMTSLTFQLSRALAKSWQPGDEIMVTRLDHDANVSPWVLAALDAGVQVRWVGINPEDCTLDLDSFRRQLNSHTRLVAVGAASNVAGTLNDVAGIIRQARQVGALVYVDAVHFAPHGPIDVQAWGCDFLACSAYKFFGPHVGILWGRRRLLEELPAYKVRPAPDTLPGKWMTGTQNHEGLAGVAATIAYLADLGQKCAEFRPAFAPMTGQRLDVHAGLAAIQEYERNLSRRLLAGLAERPRFKVWGITDPAHLASRVPTVSLTLGKTNAVDLARHLADHDIYAWNGNHYALELSESLGLEGQGGFLRLGLVHYNTVEEIERVLEVLDLWHG